MKKFVWIVISIFLITFGSTSGYFILSKPTYLVSKVLDGDTIKLVDGKEVRLIGINAPEKNEFYFEESKNKLKELIEGKKVTLEKSVEDKDMHGRLLRYIFLNSTFINLEMVRQGYAYAYFESPTEKYYTEFKNAENEARSKQLGLWKISFYSTCISITEFHYDAKGNDNQNLNDEYVIFKNNCNSINMKGWKVKDAVVNIYIFPEIIFKPNATITLFSGSGSDTDDKLYWNRRYAVWNNDGDTLYLRDGEGRLVLTYSYP